jgi:thiamine pyrophosphate-dependent acetolactate synthase large subunit-like protein
MNFPSTHPLYNTGTVAESDVILGLELADLWFVTHRQTPASRLGMVNHSVLNPGTTVVTITAEDLFGHSNYQDFGRYAEADLAIAADAEATLPALIEACRKLITPARKRAFAARGRALIERHKVARDRDFALATYAWDASPVSTARLSAELWNHVRHEDWSVVSVLGWVSNWPARLWDFDKPYQYIGVHGAYGIGYGAPAAVGAALANRKFGRLSINIQCDGDLNYAPAVLWTAAHHRIPLLSIMHNNRAYHQETMLLQQMANRAERSPERAHIGTALTNPNIDYAMLGKAYGVYSEGPIENPADLGPAIKRAIDVVKRGEPALVDVVTQPR